MSWIQSTRTQPMTLRLAFAGAIAIVALLPVQALASVTGTWTQLSPASAPPPRYGAGMAFDSDRGVTVLFGGAVNLNGTVINGSDTWEFDGTSWTQRAPAASPPGRREFAMVYDALIHKTVLFGGVGDSGWLNDTWVYDSNTWTQVASPTAPSQRLDPAMTYDSTRGVVLLFGGALFTNTPYADTWAFDGTSWTQLSPATSPPGRYAAGLAFDSLRAKAVLYGGDFNSAPAFNDTWEWDGVNWSQVPAATPGPARAQFGFTYDASIRSTVLYGGADSSGYTVAGTWLYDGSSWIQANTSTDPNCRMFPGLVYDSVRRADVLFGGWANCPAYFPGYVGDTWTFSTSTPLSVTGTSLAAVEGAALQATVASIGGGTAPYSAMIAWGDGTQSSGSVTASGSAYSVVGQHTYAEEGVYHATVTVTDAIGSVASATDNVTVSDAPLSASTTASSTGRRVTVSTTFTDADPGGTVTDYTANIAWGDGTATAGVPITSLGSGFALVSSHTYRTGGTNTIAVTISDAGGASVTNIVAVSVK